jgi:Tfp pilus assembly protein PilF
MKWRQIAKWAVVLAAPLTAPGCGTTRNRGTEASVPKGPTVEAPPQAAKDLSHDAAVKVSLAVAGELEKSGYFNEAIEQYEKVKKLDPRSTRAAHRLAVLHDRKGDVVRAQAEYERALEMDPKNPDLLNDMGYFCYGRGDWAGAERWLRKAVAAAPKNERARVNLGMAVAQQGKSAEALSEFSKVVTPAQAQANLGLIEAQRGRTEEARQALRKSLMLEPDAKIVQAALAALEKPADAVTDQKPGSPRISAN